MNNNECIHKWRYQMSEYICEKVGRYTNEYSRIDTYYCENCCEIRERISKMESKDINKGKPLWWKSNIK